MDGSFQFDVEEDTWLAKWLHQPAYKLSLSKSDRGQVLGSYSQPGFYYSKISSSRTRCVEYLVRNNFVIASLDVTLELISPKIHKAAENSRAKVTAAQPFMKETIAEIASNCFAQDRFHQDPAIENGVADQIKSEWVKNYFDGRRGTHMFVAKIKDQIVGFILLIVADATATIDLIGVQKKFHGQGVGRALIDEGIRQIESRQWIVGTQANNYASLSLYHALGFKVVDGNCSMHAHMKTGF